MSRKRGALRVLGTLLSQTSRFFQSSGRLPLALFMALTLGGAAQAGAISMFSGNSSGEKPQSKIFECDGSWWCVLDGPKGVAIYEKVGSSWQIGTFADAILTPNGNADVKWNGTNLFVLVYSSSPKLYKYTYDGSLRIFELVSGFPVSVPNPSGSETMVLEQDTTGRLWTTAEGGGNINVYYSTSSDHRTWTTTPIVLQSGVGSDDISSVIAFGNKIGVFWSDQNRDQFGFRVHNDSASPTTWGSIEIADSGSGHADDHINLACDSSGRVFAVSKNDSDRMSIHRRSTSGSWTTRHDITGVDCTRSIIMLSEAENRIYVLFTRWGVSPEPIQYVTADMDALSFQNPTTFISASSNLNNVTGTKGNLPKGNLIGIASSGSYHYNSFGSLPSSAPPPENLVATLQRNPTRVTLAWDAPASGSPSGYNIYRQQDGGTFTRVNSAPVLTRSFTDSAPPSAYLCYQVRAIFNSESAPSNTDCADAHDILPPGAPLNLSAALGWNSANPRVDLSWDAPLTGGPAVGYHVYRSTNGGSMQRITTALVTSRTYTDANPGLGQVCYEVTAENIEQEAGSASNPACTEILAAPGAPNGLNVALQGTTPASALVAWQPPSSGAPAVGYLVDRSVQGGTFQRLTPAPITTLDFVDATLETGEHCYRVCAVDAQGRVGTLTSSACVDLALPPPPPPSAPTHVTAELDEVDAGGAGTAAVFLMDEGSGGTTSDATGFGHTAQLGSKPDADSSDPSWVPGATGSALNFDGTDYLRVESAPDLQFAGSFTLEAWVLRASTGTTDCIVAKGGSNTRNYWMMLQSDGRVDFRWETSSGSNHGAQSSAIVDVGAWHHVACVYDKAAGQDRIYIDGAQVLGSSDSGTPVTNNDPVYIGARMSGSSLTSNFGGAIDMVRLSSSALYTSDFTPLLRFGKLPVVRVAWEPPTQGSAQGYRVYRSIAGQPAAPVGANPITTTSYIDFDPVDSACYQVSAIDASAQKSALSDPACLNAAPPDSIQIGPPTDVTAVAIQVGGGNVVSAASYPMDEGDGEFTSDATGAGHVAQLGSTPELDSQDPTWIDGVSGSALDFDGTDYLLVASTPSLQMNSSFTLEAWLYRDLAGTTDCIVSKGNSNTRNYWMMLNADGSIDFRWETSNGSNHGTTSATTVGLDTWQHVACVYDQAAGQDRIYSDGVLVQSADDSGTPVVDNEPVYIGTRTSGSRLTSYFNGGLDLVRISPGAIYTADFTPTTLFAGNAAQPAVRIRWNAPAGGAVGYNVYRNDGGTFARLNATLLTETEYVDLASAGAHCYRVTAVGAGEIESAGADACVSGPAGAKHAPVFATAAVPLTARFDVHPNPFNPSTRIVFDLPSARPVVLELFDVRGRRIATLLHGQREAGHYSVGWDGRDDHGLQVESGTYFVRLAAGSFLATQKLVVLK